MTGCAESAEEAQHSQTTRSGVAKRRIEIIIVAPERRAAAVGAAPIDGQLCGHIRRTSGSPNLASTGARRLAFVGGAARTFRKARGFRVSGPVTGCPGRVIRSMSPRRGRCGTEIAPIRLAPDDPDQTPYERSRSNVLTCSNQTASVNDLEFDSTVFSSRARRAWSTLHRVRNGHWEGLRTALVSRR